MHMHMGDIFFSVSVATVSYVLFASESTPPDSSISASAPKWLSHFNFFDRKVGFQKKKMDKDKILLKGTMFKRAQGRSKSSFPKNWKERFFVLTPSKLSYAEKEGGAEKASIETSTISVAEIVKDNSFDRGCHLFQVVHGLPSLTLYIQAYDNSQRSAWLDAIRALIVPARRGTLYHPGYLESKDTWTCCDKAPNVEGCQCCTLDEYGVVSIVSSCLQRPASAAATVTPNHLKTCRGAYSICARHALSAKARCTGRAVRTEACSPALPRCGGSAREAS